MVTSRYSLMSIVTRVILQNQTTLDIGPNILTYLTLVSMKIKKKKVKKTQQGMFMTMLVKTISISDDELISHVTGVHLTPVKSISAERLMDGKPFAPSLMGLWSILENV